MQSSGETLLNGGTLSGGPDRFLVGPQSKGPERVSARRRWRRRTASFDYTQSNVKTRGDSGQD